MQTIGTISLLEGEGRPRGAFCCVAAQLLRINGSSAPPEISCKFIDEPHCRLVLCESLHAHAGALGETSVARQLNGKDVECRPRASNVIEDESYWGSFQLFWRSAGERLGVVALKTLL